MIFWGMTRGLKLENNCQKEDKDYCSSELLVDAGVFFDASGEGDINLGSSRHPCLEMQEDVSFISNDVELQKGEP